MEGVGARQGETTDRSDRQGVSPRIRRRPTISGRTRVVGYVRFVLKRKPQASGVATGVFEAAGGIAHLLHTP
jgi:hypothetical protein